MNAARKLHLENIPSSELEAECLERAIDRGAHQIRAAVDTLGRLIDKQSRRKHEQLRQLKQAGVTRNKS